MSIRLTALTHDFKTHPALHHATLHILPGDIYGFIGHNGAGKTTALRIALSLLRPDSGAVTIDGHDALATPRVRALVGALIEQPGFHAALSVRKNLLLLARLQGLTPTAAADDVDRCLRLVDLAAAADKPAGHCSQGMRQRLGLAQALLGSPRYLLLDEPTNGLDPEGIHDLRRLLRELATETGVTILLSSHLLPEVAGLCTRIGVLHQGRMLVEAPTAELLGGDHPTFHLATDDNDRARALLATDDHVTVTPTGDGTLAVTFSTPTAADSTVTDLVTRGLRVRKWSPVETTLEQIYLDYARGVRTTASSPPAAPASEPASPPAPLPRCRAPIARIRRYETTRLLRPAPLLALLTPALIAPLVVYKRALDLHSDAAAVAGRKLASATQVTAFEALARALHAGLPLLTLVVAGLASQSLAGELASGTLRNVLLRPFHRREIALGKLVTHLGLAVLAYLALLVSAALAAGAWFDYGDLVEILGTNGAAFPLLPAAEVWPRLWPALASPLLPLAAFVGVGFACGALTRGAAGALALTLGTVIGLELTRGVARIPDLEALLPGPYLPWPWARNSHMDFLVDFAGGVSNASHEFAATGLLVPGAWLLASSALALLVFRRRYVP